MAVSNLDIAKFAKVNALMKGGATEGERIAAKARATAMAKAAGLSLDQAMSKLDSAPPVTVNFFAGFDDWMEERQPGYKAEEAAKRSRRNARNDERRAEILKLYGSEAALFARNTQEAALDQAIHPLAEWAYWTDSDGWQHRYASKLDGIKPAYGGWSVEDISPAIRTAVIGAYPWPSTLDAALREVQAWDRLRLDRGLFCDAGEYTHFSEVECRIELLEHELESARPAASWQDVLTRFAWKRYREERQWIDPTKISDPFLERLEADITAMINAGNSGNDQPRTAKDRRRSVLAMLTDHPELPDREIARRCGVSPTTVGSLRRKAAGSSGLAATPMVP